MARARPALRNDSVPSAERNVMVVFLLVFEDYVAV